MLRKLLIVLFAIFVILLFAGCINELLMIGAADPAGVRVILVNTSSSRFVSPNIGLCPQGIDAGGHSFLSSPPVLAPGESISYTSRQIGGMSGVCEGAGPNFMIGLCGWSYGDSAASMTRYDKKYGGQVGHQFNCGDIIILRWSSDGPECGQWTSETLTAPNNGKATEAFQLIESGGSCSV